MKPFVLVLFCFIHFHQELTAQYDEVLQFFDSQYAEPIKVSPDHSKLLLRGKSGELFYLIVLNLENKTTDTIHVSEINPFSLTWHPNSDEIYFQQKTERTRRYDLHNIKIRDKAHHILDVPQSSNAIPPLVFNDDGSKLAYLALSSIFVINTSNYKIENSFSGYSRFTNFHWISKNVLLASRYEEGRIEALQNGQTKVYFENDDFERIQKLVVANDTLFLQARRMADQFYSIYKIYDQKLVRIETPGDATDLKKIGNYVSYGYLENGQVKNMHTNAINLEGSFYLTGADKNGIFGIQKTLMCPPRYVYIRNRKKRIKTLYQPNQNYCVGRPDLLHFSRKNNSIFPVWMWSPKKRKPTKTVLYLHGGPHLYVPPVWDDWISLLVDENYRVVIPNYQGSTGFGKDLERRSVSIESKDIVNVINNLKEEYNLDLQDLIIVGLSYGAKIAFSMTNHFPEIGSLVSISGALSSSVPFNNDCKVNQNIAHYGAWDDHTLTNAREFLESAGMDKSKLSIHKKEGHVFYKSGTWAQVFNQVLNMK